MKLILLVSAAAAAHAAAPKVLVFGDSWGSFGPSYKALAEMFSSRNISANVQGSTSSAPCSRRAASPAPPSEIRCSATALLAR